MTADRLDLDALADLEAEAVAASKRNDGQHVLKMRPHEVLDLIAAAREHDAAQAALARVEVLLIEARSLIATRGTGREAQIVKDALATIRAAADEGQEAGGK